ncbi:hypothetical protein [Paraburkholderia heleia]|uniref:hypothetical protein n=1 Tax=Paraburkholderia heleia TaxID=634127 RepID=UPI002AB739F4|nr:hypothetical protein [Paraburkholderia heleia]
MFAVLIAVAGLALALFVSLSSNSRVASVTAQRDALRAANVLVQSFIGQNARLPCASATVNGLEDCSIVGIGYLPTATLLAAGGQASSSLPPLRYVVQRSGAAGDLTQATDFYQPREVSGMSLTAYLAANASVQTVGTSGYPTVISNLDLCAKLSAMYPNASPWSWGVASNVSSSPVASQAEVSGANESPAANVVYAVAAGSGTNGYGSGSFGDINAGTGLEMDSPLQSLGPSYGDQVLAVTAAQVAERMKCRMAVPSVDLLAASVAFADDVQSDKQGDLNTLAANIALLVIIVAEDGVYDSLRLAQLAITGYEKQDAIANIVIDTFMLDFVQVAADIAAAPQLANALANAAAQTGATAADSLYLAQYEGLQSSTAAVNVWVGGAVGLVLPADIHGASLQVDGL